MRMTARLKLHTYFCKLAIVEAIPRIQFKDKAIVDMAFMPYCHVDREEDREEDRQDYEAVNIQVVKEERDLLLSKGVQCKLYHSSKDGETGPKTESNAPSCCRVFLFTEGVNFPTCFFNLQHIPHRCQANATSSSLFFDARPRIRAQRAAICVNSGKSH